MPQLIEEEDVCDNGIYRSSQQPWEPMKPWNRWMTCALSNQRRRRWIHYRSVRTLSSEGRAFDWTVRGRNYVTAFHPMGNQGIVWACTVGLSWREGGGQQLNSPLQHKMFITDNYCLDDLICCCCSTFPKLLYPYWDSNGLVGDAKRNESNRKYFFLSQRPSSCMTHNFRTRPLVFPRFDTMRCCSAFQIKPMKRNGA